MQPQLHYQQIQKQQLQQFWSQQMQEMEQVNGTGWLVCLDEYSFTECLGLILFKAHLASILILYLDFIFGMHGTMGYENLQNILKEKNSCNWRVLEELWRANGEQSWKWGHNAYYVFQWEVSN